MNKPDRRIERTRRLLETALIELIAEKPYAEITVQDITDRANVGRTTFYFHYKDREELLAGTIQALIADMTGRVPPFSMEAVAQGQVLVGLAGFEHVAEHRDFYRAMLGPNGPAYIAGRVRSAIAGVMQERLEIIIRLTGSTLPVEVMAYHLAGSMIGLIGWWLQGDMQHSPQEMATMFQALNRPGIEAAIRGQNTQS
jgi:AcrR family transcriptional regulator